MENFIKGFISGSLLFGLTVAGLFTGNWIPVAIMWAVVVLVVGGFFLLLHLVYGRQG